MFWHDIVFMELLYCVANFEVVWTWNKEAVVENAKSDDCTSPSPVLFYYLYISSCSFMYLCVPCYCDACLSLARGVWEWSRYTITGLTKTFASLPFKMHHRSKCTMFFQEELQHQKRISLFFVKSAMQKYFHNVQVSCYCCVTWYETRTIFSLLYSHLRWSFCGIMLLHVACGGLLYLYFYIPQY